MSWKPLLYCRICWQEFDRPEEHGLGSLLSTRTGTVRLNGICPGKTSDIHAIADRPKTVKFTKQSESLSLDAGDPIRL